MKLFNRHKTTYPAHGTGKACPAVLFFWFLIASIVPNSILSVTEKLSWMQSAANIFLPAGLYWFILSLSRNPGKPVLWMFPITFLAAFELVLLYLYGRSVIAVDMWLNLVTSNATEAGELLADLLTVLCVVVILYLIPIIMAIISIVRHWTLSERFIVSQRVTSMVITAIGVITFCLSFFAGSHPYRPLKDLFPLNAVTNCVIAFDRYNQTSEYHKTSSRYRHDSKYCSTDSLKAVTVIVIGETSRADNWQLSGYSRQTNPRLSNRRGIYFYPMVMSESNTTHKSVPMLLSCIDSQTFADSVNYVKSIISAFGEARYHTNFYSAQQRNHSYIDFFGEEADSWGFLIEKPGISNEAGARDNALVNRLCKILESSDSNELIVLHTYGSHYNYNDRYAMSAAHFLPDRPLEANILMRDRLINAYDNTIVYTDSILNSVIDIVEKSGRIGTVIYASDHGEDIYDDDRGLFLHASPVPTFRQLHVPFLVWVSNEFEMRYPDLCNALDANRSKKVSSSRSFYHTALDLGRVETKDFRPDASLASRKYNFSDYRYLNDHNESLDLKEAGFDDIDFRNLNAIQVSRQSNASGLHR